MRRLTLLAAAITLRGCLPPRAIWIETGSRVDHLVIGYSTTRGGTEPTYFSTLFVEECGTRPHTVGARFWLISRRGPLVGYPTRITYGVAPEGFHSESGPSALRAGCFHVSTVEVQTTFDIQPDGRVVERPDQKLSVR